MTPTPPKSSAEPSPEPLYPCAHPGCTTMRTKAAGGDLFTVCEDHWDFKPSPAPVGGTEDSALADAALLAAVELYAKHARRQVPGTACVCRGCMDIRFALRSRSTGGGPDGYVVGWKATAAEEWKQHHDVAVMAKRDAAELVAKEWAEMGHTTRIRAYRLVPLDVSQPKEGK